jgi:hypothetical protein
LFCYTDALSRDIVVPDFGMMVPAALGSFSPELNYLLDAEMMTGEALLAISMPLRVTILHGDITDGTDLRANAA